MRNVSALAGIEESSPDWTTERLDSWKEIASFFKREVRTVQLWERSEGLPVRRQYHKKVGSVYAYRRELEEWWIKRSALGSMAALPHESGSPATRSACTAPAPISAPVEPSPRQASREACGVLVFPIEVAHSWRDRGPLKQIVDRFAAGLAADLGFELRRLQWNPMCLAVGALPSPASTPEFMRNLAIELGAKCYVAGTVRYAKNQVRVSLQLVRTEDAMCVWLDRFDTALDHVFQAQAELAQQIAASMPEYEAHRPARPAPVRALEPGPAYHARMMGLHFWKQRTNTDLLRAMTYFQDAILLDPACADAYAGLADTYVSLSYHHLIPARQAIATARHAVETAMRLAPGSRFVRQADINFKSNCTWEWEAAEQALQELLHSGRLDARTLQLYANLMIGLGRHDEAIDAALQALRLDPLTDCANTQLSFAYFYAGDYDRALPFAQKAIELNPRGTMGYTLLGRTEAARGNWDRAVEAFHHGLALAEGSTFLKALLAYAFAGKGDAATASGILREIETERYGECFPACDVSAVHAILNQESEALSHLRAAYDMREMKVSWLQYDPRFACLRRLEEFQQITSSVFARAN